MIKKIFISLLLIFNLVPVLVSAQEEEAPSTPEINQGAVVESLELDNIPSVQANDTTLNNILEVVFTIAGVLSVVFIVIGGFQMVLSAGDPTGVGQARRTILYAVIGLIVSLSAFIIVRFVLGKL